MQMKEVKKISKNKGCCCNKKSNKTKEVPMEAAKRTSNQLGAMDSSTKMSEV
jgi:hypothetical protein